MRKPNIQRIHAFELVARRGDFLDQVPSVVAQAVQEARERMPSHPAFATGSVAHNYAHRDLALASPALNPKVPEGSRFYVEAHLRSQCRGAFVIEGAESAFPVFLASGVRKNEHEFTLYTKGTMTLNEAGGQPALFELDADFAAADHGRAFFLVVNRFQPRPGEEGIEVHLVWGFLKDDRRTLRAEFLKRLGDTDLPPAPIVPKSPDIPPVFTVDPMILIVEDSDGS